MLKKVGKNFIAISRYSIYIGIGGGGAINKKKPPRRTAVKGKRVYTRRKPAISSGLFVKQDWSL